MLAVRACHGRTLRNASGSAKRTLSAQLSLLHPSRIPLTSTMVAEGPRRRVMPSQSYSQNHSATKGKGPTTVDKGHHDDTQSHSHSHSHSLFGGHSHTHDGPSSLAEVLGKSGSYDRGSRITILGLVVNVGLTGAKGTAGWYMNSAALLAEAGHSASDLLGDLVTLFAWRFSRRTPTLNYPYGFGKFETIGTAAVALILIGGAAGIGVHALHLLAAHLSGPAAASLPATGAAAELVRNASEVAQAVGGLLPHTHSHGHAHGSGGGLLDPNAAWFALASVVIKEWLYRVTQRVADAERSSVLAANAVHHRADAYTSGVALVAILGTWAFPALPLDPIGGLLVALVVLRQGVSLLMGAVGELTDRGVSPRAREALLDALAPLVEEGKVNGKVEQVEELRAVRAGAMLFVDVRLRVPGSMSVDETSLIEEQIREALRSVRSDLAEVRIRFVPRLSSEVSGTMNGNGGTDLHS